MVPSQQACGSGPCSFDVWLKDGSHLTYAAAVPAVAAGGASIPARSVRAWQLSSVTDLHGNAYAVTYSQKPTDVSGKPVSGTAGAGMRYPVRIDYTSGALGLVAQRSVQFYYEAWPGAPAQYEGGAVFTRAARLAEIQTCIDARAIGGKSCAAATLVGRYVMSYASNAPPGRSWLSSLKECDGKGNCLPPVRFEWTPDTKQLVQQQASGRSVLNAPTYVGDFDGNGLTDILAVQPGAAQVLLRQATGFQSAPNTGLNLNVATTVWVADFNGDGRTDVFAVGSSDALYISTGRFAGDRPGFSSIPVSNVKLLAYTFIGDVNGDGKADVLTAEGSVGWLYLSTGSGFVKQPNIAGLTLFGANKTWLADFNGDSMADSAH